jgi:hypothetical protein
MKKLIAFAAAVLTSNSAFAGYGIATVDELHVDAEGYVEFGTTVTLPGTCNWFIDTFRFNGTSAAGKNMLAMLMTAKVAGIPLTIWYNDSTTPGTNQGNGCTQATMAVPTALGIR